MVHLLLTLAAAAPPTAPERAWIDAHAIPVATADPSAPLDDLRPLLAHLQGARVVGLGECTHGTREAFQLKHRLTQLLMDELGFTAFAIEASLPATLPLGAWIAGGEGDRDRLVAGMGFWTWSTEEVAAMAQWMRGAHPGTAASPTWWGIDMQDPAAAVRVLQRELADQPDRLAALDAVWDGMLSEPAILNVHVGDAAGARRAGIEAQIRTEAADGVASLWVQALDAHDKVLAFDAFPYRASGDTDWARWRGQLHLPPGTAEVQAGLMVRGAGLVELDDLRLTLDGAPWAPVAGVDLAFDLATPPVVDDEARRRTARARGWAISAPGREVLRTEDGALRVNGVRASPEAQYAALPAIREGTALSSLADRVLETAIQAVQMEAGPTPAAQSARRDLAMAANTLWLLEQQRGPIVVWAHNAHVSRGPGWMGAHLAAALGEAYVPLGFACGSGSYTAADPRGPGLQTWTLSRPVADSVEARLAAMGAPSSILDLRETADAPDAAWLRAPLRHRQIGAIPAAGFELPTPLHTLYDLLLWLPASTASRGLTF